MNQNIPKTLLISFSGGRTSAFMTKYLLEHPYYQKFKKVIAFANTGKEREETLEFVDRCDREWNLGVKWVEAVFNPVKGIGTNFKLVDFKSAARNGEPFEKLIQKFGIPNVARPHCTRELKIVPLKKLMQSLGHKKWFTAIGIRSDELNRVNRRIAHKERKIYPLVDQIRATKAFINNWWLKQPFDLELRGFEGNCDLCYKKSLRKLLTIVQEQPKLLDWWKQMEQNYDGDYHFFRRNRSAEDIRKLAEEGNFVKAIDAGLHQPYDPNLDIEFSYMCKST